LENNVGSTGEGDVGVFVEGFGEVGIGGVGLEAGWKYEH
jgi:hypothetical protein